MTRVVVAAGPLIALALLIWPSSLALPPSVSIAAEPPAKASPPEATNAYVGSETCLQCHGDLEEKYKKTIHAKVFTEANARTPLALRGCEACHGPGKVHVDAGGGKGVGDMIPFRRETPQAIERENAVCLTCHEKGKRTYWQGSPHQSRDLACTNCHKVMEKVSDRFQLAKGEVVEVCAQCHLVRRSQTFRNAHMPLREGKITCTSCHNPHGTITKSLLPENSINDNCYKCHADKRGPFLWEHPPVLESCANCHDPHGGVREKMLKLSLPRLCQQCHIESRHPTEARLPTNKLVIGRACVQCHANIHGSNHPSGFAFTR